MAPCGVEEVEQVRAHRRGLAVRHRRERVHSLRVGRAVDDVDVCIDTYICMYFFIYIYMS